MSLFDKEALAGKRILITGGGTGLGKGVADFFVAHGAEVHLWGRRGAVVEAAAKEINDRHGSTRVHFQSVDIRSAEQIDAAMSVIWTKYGPLTGVLNNAAANFIAPTKYLSPRGFEAITSTVMNGAFFTTQAAGKRWIAEKRTGSVVSMLVSWVWTGSAFVVPSAMAKAAVDVMTKSLAVEWGGYGIRINAVAPGPFPTDYAWEMLSPTPESAVGATQSDEVPFGRRYGQMHELANALILLFSDGCDYLTGQTIAIDGAHHLAAPSTFAGLTKLSDADWKTIRERSQAATAVSKAERSV
jgi:NAD(P)-dependent dehydrogenase (short-subunit alcohol dehydrogenase family)